MVQRITKEQAMVSMEISSSTLERRIKSGEVQVEVDHEGGRRRVWVLADDNQGDIPPGNHPGIHEGTDGNEVTIL